VHLEFQKMMNQTGVDCTSFGDSPSGPAVISPAMFRKFSLPWHKKLNAALQELNIQTICHICGNIDLILDDLAQVGYTGIEMDYKTNVKRAADLFKGKSTVFGPIDPSGMFYYGTPEKMRAEVRHVLDTFKAEGNLFAENGKPVGIVLGAGCAIPAGAPEANIRAFVEEAREYY
jgi:uroporphyrinogen-III decarboxylase